jgi:adenine deaminase
MRNDAVEPAVRARAVAAAQGREPFDLLLAGGTVVDVGCGELRAADVGIVGPLVASVHERGSRTDALDVVDCTGRFVAPGFIDMHVHFESSMLTPGGYTEAVCPRGTTTVFVDPHELANVAGVAGVRYAVEASRGLPVRFIVQAPSCVPPQPGLELSGADLYGPDITEMLSWDEVGGLAEVMDMIGVLGAADRMVDVVAAGIESGKLVSGHAAGLTGPVLQAYLAAGMTSDHEIFTEPDCLEKLRAGMTVELRGMIDEILPAIVAEVKSLPLTPTHLVAATDDLFALTLLNAGGIDHLLRRLVAYGLDAVLALRIATYNAAYRLQRADLGLVSAGHRADIVVLTDLESFTAEHVITDGNLVASHGEMLASVLEGPSDPPLDTMKLVHLDPDDMLLRLDAPDGTHRMRVIADAVMTRWDESDVVVRDGVVEVPDNDIVQVSVHRHGRITPVPHSALLSGWGNWTGAVATTVAHDTHNLVVFGRDPHDMALAANTVIASGGGLAVVRAGEVLARLALPIAGILSPLPPAELAAVQKTVQDAAIEIGLFAPTLTQPLFQVMLSSLACLPGPHVTDVGLIDGTTGEVVATALIS